LYRIRKEFLHDANEFRKILKSKEIQSVWGELEGSELKTAPRNFDKNHTDIDLIRKKQFIFKINYSDKEVLEKRFIDKVELSLKAIRPFLNYMTDILITDENGESIY
jgi:uncharacterized protein (DUF2461 family)